MYGYMISVLDIMYGYMISVLDIMYGYMISVLDIMYDYMISILCACTEILWMGVLYVSFGSKVGPRTFGCVAVGSAVLF